MTGRQGLPALAVVVALTTVAVVALAEPDADVPRAAAAVAAGILAVAFIAVATGIEHRDQHPFPYGALLLRLAPIPAVLLGMLLLWLLPDGDRPLEEGSSDAGRSDRQRDPGEEDEHGIDQINEIIDLVYAVVSVVAAAAALYLAQRLIRRWIRVRRARTASAPGPAGTVTESDDPERWSREARRRAVRGGLERGRAALLDETDPRRAIVQAYLAFEDHVRREGLAREPAETQREYAARVLAAGGVSEPRHVTELVELFNAARFSTDPMGEADAAAARDHMDTLVGA